MSVPARMYLQRDLTEVKRKRGNLKGKFTRIKIDTPAVHKYPPELDDASFLDNDDEIQMHQSYIEII